MPFNLLGASITWDTEGNGLLDDTTIDYTASPFKLKPEFAMHCIVVEIHETNDLYCFYNGDKIILDGRPYVNEFPEYTVELKNYAPVEYVHMQLDQFPEFIKSVSPKKVVAHNQINYDLLATKLYFGMDYKVGLTGNPELPDEWAGFYTDLVDSMVLSKTLNPDRYGGHSLDALSEKAGLRKIAFRKDVHESVRFKHFAPDMLYYCIVDVKANTQVFIMLEAERLSDGWDWADAISLEKAVADIITRQEHRGFKFDVDLAEANVVELDALMEERRQRIEPILPPKPATKKFMSDFTPPKNQFKKDGTVAANLVKFANKIGATIHYNAERESVPEKFEFNGVVYDLPLPIEPLVTEQVATVNDTTHIKDWLVGLGWEPSEYKEKDITKDSKGKVALDAEKYEAAVERYVDQTLSTNFCTHRCEHLGTSPGKLKSMLLKANNGKRGIKVITNPSFTKGQEKEICPNLLLMSEQFPYAKDIVEYLTYKHRRNSILGGGAEWDDDEEPEKGYMAYVRADGRVPTPAGTCDAACVTADTIILTDNGPQKVVDVCIGDLVLTHRGRYRPVVDRVNNGIKSILRVETESGLILESTENHPFLTKEGWKRADQLSTGTEVYVYAAPEQWEEVPGFSRYYISSWGRVLTNEGTYLKTLRRVAVWSRAECDFTRDDGTRYRTSIGRMVLRAFVGEPLAGYECCHRDGNPCNNYLENLYWGTSKENSEDASIHGRALRAARERKNAVLTEEEINEIREYFLHFGYKRGDDTRLAKQYKCSRQYIGDIRHGRRWKEEANTDNLYTETFKLQKIVSVTPVQSAPTFDITVEEDHSYVANGYVTHNTSRMKHRKVANIPRTTSLYGEKMRALFGVSDNCYQIGYDFDSLEAREEAHYCYPYEDAPREYCEALLMEKPFDVHTMMAKKISEIIGREFGRSPAKNVKYGITYGAQAAKVAKTIGSDIETGNVVFEAFWEAAAPLKSLKDRLQAYWERRGGRKFILGIDGRKVPTRSAHAILNSLFQSAGVICAKRAMVIHDRKLREAGLAVDFFMDDWKNMSYFQQVISYHDEAQGEVTKDLVEFKVFRHSDDEESKDAAKEACKAWKAEAEATTGRVWSDVSHGKSCYYVAYSLPGQLASESVREAGEYYNLRVPLTAGYVVGRNWAETH